MDETPEAPEEESAAMYYLMTYDHPSIGHTFAALWADTLISAASIVRTVFGGTNIRAVPYPVDPELPDVRDVTPAARQAGGLGPISIVSKSPFGIIACDGFRRSFLVTLERGKTVARKILVPPGDAT